jgi:transposase
MQQTIRERIIIQLEAGAGTCRQLADRMGDVKLSSIRSIVSRLKKEGIVRPREKAGKENVWRLNAM